MTGRNAFGPAVLIVDGEAPVRMLLRVFLKMYVPEEMIVTVSDGAEALTYLSAHNVRLIITDNQMPHLTGLELTQIVKARHPETCIILLSGDLLHDIESSARAAGADYFLSKPFSVDQLRQILDGLFSNSLDERSVGRG